MYVEHKCPTIARERRVSENSRLRAIYALDAAALAEDTPDCRATQTAFRYLIQVGAHQVLRRDGPVVPINANGYNKVPLDPIYRQTALANFASSATRAAGSPRRSLPN